MHLVWTSFSRKSGLLYALWRSVTCLRCTMFVMHAFSLANQATYTNYESPILKQAIFGVSLSQDTCLISFMKISISILAAQAAKERQSAAQTKAPKRPTLKRPIPKPASDPATGQDQDSQPVKRPRLDTLLQQSNTQQKAGAASGDRSAAQAWSPAQQAQLPYSPGEIAFHSLCCSKAMHTCRC